METPQEASNYNAAVPPPQHAWASQAPLSQYPPLDGRRSAQATNIPLHEMLGNLPHPDAEHVYPPQSAHPPQNGHAPQNVYSPQNGYPRPGLYLPQSAYPPQNVYAAQSQPMPGAGHPGGYTSVEEVSTTVDPAASYSRPELATTTPMNVDPSLEGAPPSKRRQIPRPSAASIAMTQQDALIQGQDAPGGDANEQIAAPSMRASTISQGMHGIYGMQGDATTAEFLPPMEYSQQKQAQSYPRSMRQTSIGPMNGVLNDEHSANHRDVRPAAGLQSDDGDNLDDDQIGGSHNAHARMCQNAPAAQKAGPEYAGRFQLRGAAVLMTNPQVLPAPASAASLAQAFELETDGADDAQQGPTRPQRGAKGMHASRMQAQSAHVAGAAAEAADDAMPANIIPESKRPGAMDSDVTIDPDATMRPASEDVADAADALHGQILPRPQTVHKASQGRVAVPATAAATIKSGGRPVPATLSAKKPSQPPSRSLPQGRAACSSTETESHPATAMEDDSTRSIAAPKPAPKAAVNISEDAAESSQHPEDPGRISPGHPQPMSHVGDDSSAGADLHDAAARKLATSREEQPHGMNGIIKPEGSLTRPLRKTVSWHENDLFDERNDLVQRAKQLHEMSLDLQQWLNDHGGLGPVLRRKEAEVRFSK